MSDETFFISGVFCLSLLIFLVPGQIKYYLSLAILALVVVVTSYLSLNQIFEKTAVHATTELNIFPPDGLKLIIDRLSAFFIIVVNITTLTGLLYAKGYLRPYYKVKNDIHMSVHYFSYLLLYFSMLLVVMLRDGIPFLIFWEIMAVASFLLVIFDAEDRSILKSGIGYLVQMHIGMFFILAAFLIVEKKTGIMSFDGLKNYFAFNPDTFLFLLFFIGFGIKAGFISLHTWLPEAHPAAPSHVSGVMSGVMIKMGIYGIIRVLLYVQDDLLTIGLIVIAVSLFSGLFGVMMAIVQHDIKRLLAYHSIENIGIIGIGIGLGVIGLAVNNQVLAVLGFTGGLLHVLNHSLFKSLLFFSAGSVYQATHTRNIEQLGGLMKRMPWSAALFLTGSLAICGLPPFNGFISEYLIYIGMFKSLPLSDLYISLLLISAIIGLSLIGGLAIFCFTKAFGVTFLGEPRSAKAGEARETGMDMIIPQLIPVLFIVLIGIASTFFVRPLISVISDAFAIAAVPQSISASVSSLNAISLSAGVFVLISAALLFYRYLHLKNKKVVYGPTWGCGYRACTPRQQYTSTSFAYNYLHIAKPLIPTTKVMPEITEEEIFPEKRSFESHSEDVFRKAVADKPVEWMWKMLKKLAVMQTGRIQDYILYAFIFIIIALILTYLKVI